MKRAIFAAVFFLAACGRVSGPFPPIIRTLQKVENLSASQSGYTVVLSWTNPTRYIDNNPATDTGVVHIFRNDVEIDTVPATPAGQPQSRSVNVRNSVGSLLVFTIQLEVPGARKLSAVSNAFPIQPVAVPGIPRNLQAVVDKGQIVLTWEPPELNAGLVEAYLVQRSDKPAPSTVRVPRLVDEEYEPGKTYTYTVTAVAGTNPGIPGDGRAPRDVVAKDSNPPGTPVGLELQLLGDVLFLQWEMNTEQDLRGYQVFRSDRSEPVFTVANAYSDNDYTPGRGIFYQLVAEDVSGNPSSKSAPKPGP